MAYLYRLIVGAFFLLFLGLPAHADIPTSTYIRYQDFGLFTRAYPTSEAACSDSMTQQMASKFVDRSNGRWVQPASVKFQNGACVINAVSGFDGPNGSPKHAYGLTEVFERGSCPDNSTKAGSSCTCNTGYVESGGRCVVKQSNSCEGLSAFCQGLKGEKIVLEGKGSATPPGCASDSQRPNCAQGCAGEAGGFDISYKNGYGDQLTSQEYTLTGGTCTLPPPSDVPAKKDSECAGAVGEVNGVRVCVPSKSSSGDKSSKETKNSDGTTTTTETKTTCDKGVCTTTTTTTNKDGSGSTTSSSSSSSSVSQSTYCATNKSSQVCASTNGDKNPDPKDGTKKDSECTGDDCKEKPNKFEGSCAGGFTCQGDAINCAIAKDQYQRSCSMNDTDNPFYKLFQSDPNKDKTGAVTDKLPGNKNINIGDYIKDRDDFIAGGSCPADRTIDGPNWSVSIPYSKLCPYLEMMGNVVVICASIVAARIITRRAD